MQYIMLFHYDASFRKKSILPGFVDYDYIHLERNSNEPNPRTLYNPLHTYVSFKNTKKNKYKS